MLARLRSLGRMIFRRSRWEQETSEELQFHLEQRAEHLARSGLPRDEALRRARLEFGGVEGYREQCRESRGARWIDELSRNLVYAARSMRKSPGFTAVAVLSLALGIGANAAVFSLLHRLVLTTLPVRDPAGLYHMVLISSSGTHYTMAYPKFEMLRDNFNFFDPLFGWGKNRSDLTVEDRKQPAQVAIVTGNYFESLGLGPALGRLLTAQDEQARASEIAVISYGLWRTVFAGDPGVVGRRLKLRENTFQVIGVAPPGFFGTEPGAPPDVYLPLHAVERFTPGLLQRPGSYWFHVLARLKRDVPLATAQVALREGWLRLAEPQRIKRGYSYNRPESVVLEDGSHGYSAVRLEFSRAVLVLMGLVASVFLIACANLATLLFVRGAGRAREMSIRLALGAARAQLIRQWMTECLLLAVCGGLAGLLAARWITDLLLLFVAEADRPWLRFQASPAVLVVSVALTLAAGFLFGLLPGIRASRVSPEAMLRAHSASVTGRRGRVSQAVLAGQLAASLVLVVVAALIARTLWNLNSTPGGFDRKTTAYGAPNFNRAQFPRDRVPGVMKEVLDQLNRSPHVAQASLGGPPILWGGSAWAAVTVPGYMLAPGEDNLAYSNIAAPGYFQTLGIPMIAGRDFEEGDRFVFPGEKVAIINEKLARHYFQGRNPLGQKIQYGTRPGPVEIVGVVKDIKDVSLREPSKDLVYFPLAPNGSSAIVARAKPGVAPPVVEAEIRAAFAAAAKNVPAETGSLEDAVQRSLGRDRLVAQLSVAFGVLGVLLASIGLYGAMAHAVSSRTREIGIRIAVGADPWDVIRMVLQESLRVTGLGILIGLPAAIAGSRLISSLLFEVSPSDPLTLAVSAAILAAAALLAAWWPARRAARLDPSRALRCE
jgi:predicted permease